MVSHSLQGRSIHSLDRLSPEKIRACLASQRAWGHNLARVSKDSPVIQESVTLPGAALALCGAWSTACPPHRNLHSSTALQSALKWKKLFSQHFFSTNVSRLVSQCAINPALVCNSTFMLAPFISF